MGWLGPLEVSIHLPEKDIRIQQRGRGGGERGGGVTLVFTRGCGGISLLIKSILQQGKKGSLAATMARVKGRLDLDEPTVTMEQAERKARRARAEEEEERKAAKERERQEEMAR